MPGADGRLPGPPAERGLQRGGGAVRGRQQARHRAVLRPHQPGAGISRYIYSISTGFGTTVTWPGAGDTL